MASLVYVTTATCTASWPITSAKLSTRLAAYSRDAASVLHASGRNGSETSMTNTTSARVSWHVVVVVNEVVVLVAVVVEVIVDEVTKRDFPHCGTSTNESTPAVLNRTTNVPSSMAAHTASWISPAAASDLPTYTTWTLKMPSNSRMSTNSGKWMAFRIKSSTCARTVLTSDAVNSSNRMTGKVNCTRWIVSGVVVVVVLAVVVVLVSVAVVVVPVVLVVVVPVIVVDVSVAVVVVIVVEVCVAVVVVVVAVVVVSDVVLVVRVVDVADVVVEVAEVVVLVFDVVVDVADVVVLEIVVEVTVVVVPVVEVTVVVVRVVDVSVPVVVVLVPVAVVLVTLVVVDVNVVVVVVVHLCESIKWWKGFFVPMVTASASKLSVVYRLHCVFGRIGGGGGGGGTSAQNADSKK